MTTHPASPGAGAPSRLDPEPLTRRDFLGLSALWAAGGTILFAALGIMRLPKAAVLPSPSKRFKVTLPASLGPGETFVPPGRAVALSREGGEVRAVSLVCTHLGCIVKPDEKGFHCPCHGSRFRPDGSVEKGPAPKALPWLAVSASDGDALIVDEGKVVPPARRT